MAEEKKPEYFLCPFADTSKPRLCPAKHINAGWKCPLEKGSECAIWKMAEMLERSKGGY
jgi:hypothetical protein